MAIYLTIQQVAARLGVHPCTIHRKIKNDATFPKKYKFGEQTFRLKLEELEVWEAAQVHEL
jgi:excisionase family DNA binding protein